MKVYDALIILVEGRVLRVEQTTSEVPEPAPHMLSCPSCRVRWERGLAAYARNQVRPADTLLPGDVAYTAIMTPFGAFWVAAGDAGVVMTDAAADEVRFCWDVERAGHGVPRFVPEALDEVAAQFLQFFGGSRRRFDLEVDLRRTRPTQRAVLERVRAVRWAEVRSYGEIAYEIGKPRAARFVGTVMALSPVSILIPCHRIIRSDGTIGEYGSGACGVAKKRWLLAREGIRL